jgi:hypothetical protein
VTTILSLFDYTGNWPLPYRDHGYDVIQVDIKHGQDIMTFDFKSLPDVHGILAAPPCTHFSSSGARWFAEKDKDGRTGEMVKLVYKTLEIIDFLQPAWWAIENPVGRIASLVPELGKAWYFQPCDYGEPYTKKTGLWGSFTPPLPLFSGGFWNPVEPTEGSKMWKLPPSDERATLRSITPLGFARAFFMANP